MKRDNEFNTCLHFDLSDSLHRKTVDILENYDKKRFHSYTNFIATALTEYSEHRDDDIFIEKITEALTPKITEIVRRETMPDPDKEEIINSIDSSFMSTFSTKLNIGTEN